MNKNRWKDRIGYQLDLTMSRGTTSLIMLLSLVTLILVALAGVIVILVDQTWANGSVLYAMWKSFTLTLDPGNLAGVEGSFWLIVIAALSTIGGLFITSTLISILNTGLSARLENFQRGNAKIIEHGHTLILGFSEAVFPIVRELQIANENQKSSSIIILGTEEKQVMEELIQRRIPRSRNTRIICRNGDPTEGADLDRCSVETAKSVIINLSEDYQVIRTLLALTNYLKDEAIRKNFPQSQHLHVTATISEKKNVKVAKYAGQGYAEILYFRFLISRIMASVSYQAGLSSVYTELFNFDANEIYIQSLPELTGVTFHDAQLLFDNNIIIGVKRGSENLLNPDPGLVIAAEDKLILIAQDDDVVHPAAQLPEVDATVVLPAENRRVSEKPDHLLILGNSYFLDDILLEVNRFLPPGTPVTVAAAVRAPLNGDSTFEGSLQLELQWIDMDITDRYNLNKVLDQGADHVLILSNHDLPAEKADAQTLTTLLHIRNWQETTGKPLVLTTEMIDIRNQQLAQVANVNDFVISSNITGLIMTQVSENRELVPIFEELLDSSGANIELKPASNYVPEGRSVDLSTLTHLVSERKQVFLGYTWENTEADNRFMSGIRLNPDKKSRITFGADDRLIVLTNE